MGLENRAIAPTLMNSTSSRSHTILTIKIEQKVRTDLSTESRDSKTPSQGFSKTLRSKLLMVDLAGSERVRRTVSKGTRLSEAKSINTSLSALGNVIAALAEQNISHIPYRDSKLTRLLQDSLGGTASTALIATVGPAPVNYGETLSTLLFATRCMAVKVTPTQNEEVDYVEMCASLQSKLNAMEGVMTQKLLDQQSKYEEIIKDLNNQLEIEKSNAAQKSFDDTIQINNFTNENFLTELKTVFESLESIRTHALESEEDDSFDLDNWLSLSIKDKKKDIENEDYIPDGQLILLLGYCFKVISQLSTEFFHLIKSNMERDEEMKIELEKLFQAERKNEKMRENEISRMESEDPRNKEIRRLREKSVSAENNLEGNDIKGGLMDQKIGSHLARMSRLEALTRVEGQYRSNNDPISSYDRKVLHELDPVPIKPDIIQYSSVDDIVKDITTLHFGIKEYMVALNTLLFRKDVHYSNIKKELTDQLVEKRKREEGTLITIHPCSYVII